MSTGWKIVYVFFLVFGISGCASSKPGLGSKNRPNWIDKAGGFYEGERGKAFYGVGAASNISIVSLRRSAADAQARADLARTFKNSVDNLVKIYSRSILAGKISNEDTEQFTRETTDAFTTMELNGVPVVDRYYDASEQTQYSLAMMDIATFKNMVQQMREISEEVKENVINNAEKAFEEMYQRRDRDQGR